MSGAIIQFDHVEQEGRTVFLSSHILDEVQRMADDIAIVQAGRLISWGCAWRSARREA